MKNITINRELLADAANIAGRCTMRQNPILNSFLLRFANNSLEVISTGYDASAKVSLPTDFDGEAVRCVNAPVFQKVIASLRDETVTLDISRADVVIKRERGNIKLRTLEAHKYPDTIFGGDGYAFRFLRKDLLAALKLSGFALDTETIQAHKSTAALNIFTNLIESKFELMATNEQILSFVNGLCEKSEGTEDGTIGIPQGAVRHLLAILPVSTDEYVEMSETDNFVFVRVGSIDYALRKTTVKFSDMSAAKSVEFPIGFTINADALHSSIKRIQILCDAFTRHCTFTVTEDELTVSSGGEQGSIEESFPIKLEGDEFTTGYSTTYLLETISRTSGDVMLRFAPSSGSYALRVESEAEQVKATMFVQGLNLSVMRQAA